MEKKRIKTCTDGIPPDEGHHYLWQIQTKKNFKNESEEKLNLFTIWSLGKIK